MDYETITNELIRSLMKSHDLKAEYQEFLDSIAKYSDFTEVSMRKFNKYLESLKLGGNK
jgi:hypothetical protein